MFTCGRKLRSRIQLLCSKSPGPRVYVYQTDLCCKTTIPNFRLHCLPVQDMLTCGRKLRSRIQLLCSKSPVARVYVYQTDLWDRRPICWNSITRDSGSRGEGCWDCYDGATKGQTWQVGMRTGSWALVNEGGDSHVSSTQLAAEVWDCYWKYDLCREGVTDRKYEEYKGVRFYNGDYDLEVDRWRHVETDVRAAQFWNRFNVWVPGGMNSPWITTTSSGRDVSEYQLGTSGLQPMFCTCVS